MSKGETHYPVEGRWLNDTPHVEHDDCTNAFHVESGAFTTTKPKPAKPVEPVTESEE